MEWKIRLILCEYSAFIVPPFSISETGNKRLTSSSQLWLKLVTKTSAVHHGTSVSLNGPIAITCNHHQIGNNSCNTVKILKIGTSEIITIIVLHLERLDFTVQYCVQKMQTEYQTE